MATHFASSKKGPLAPCSTDSPPSIPTRISDALDFLNLPGATFGLRPLWDCPKIVGRASTIQLGLKTDAQPTVHIISPVIAEVQSEDRVLVIAGGIDGISCWGDILANAATAKGVRCSVIDGLSRDIEGSESIGYPVFGRGVTMIRARNRVVQTGSGAPVNVAGVVVGPAYTVKYASASTPPGTVGDFIDDVAEGDVVVIDNDGRTDCTLWGDILTRYAGTRGIAATVIDGVCHDVAKALGDGYPLFTRGRFMRTGRDRVQVESINAPVSIGTARVCARDIVVADANGVVVVPGDRARELAELARKIESV